MPQFGLILRLVSHLRDSMRRRVWSPQGMPAIYKLLEGLSARAIPTHVFFACEEPMDLPRDGLVLDNLPHLRFHALPVAGTPSNTFARFWQLGRRYHFVKTMIRRHKLDVIYADRGNVELAALLAWRRTPVVLRLHGLAKLPETLAKLENEKPNALYRKAFRAPFRRILCTREGSPAERFAQRHLAQSLELWYSGVDAPPPVSDEARRALARKFDLDPDLPVIMTVGRMDADKQPDCLADALCRLAEQGQAFNALLIGDGALLEPVRESIRRAGQETRIRCLGALAHEEALALLSLCDVFVSLNAYGNLSNAVLEAMRAGTCIVTLDACAQTGRDAQFHDPALREALVLLDRTALPTALPEALTTLLADSALRNSKAERIAEFATRELSPWTVRIEREIGMLLAIATGSGGNG